MISLPLVLTYSLILLQGPISTVILLLENLQAIIHSSATWCVEFKFSPTDRCEASSHPILQFTMGRRKIEIKAIKDDRNRSV